MPKSKKIQLNVSQYELRRIIDAKLDNDISVRKVLEYSSRPCDKCIHDFVFIKDNKGEKVKIEKGILYKESEKNAIRNSRNI